LADPYLLGVAAGAGLGATVAIVLALANWWLPIMAFLGGAVAVLVTYSIGRLSRSETSAALILAGVTVAAFFTAMQTYVQQRASDTVREVFAWILGRLTTAGWDEVLLLLPFFVVAAAVIVAHRRHLDVLAVGEVEAGALGMNVARVRLTVVLASTVLTSAAVAVSGLIGFVGIIVPHLVRMAVGTSYRVVVPLSILGGATLLAGADVAARLIVAPAELPVGVVTAFLGAPFFLLLLRTGQSR
jgi:iron complex transport system permease protein